MIFLYGIEFTSPDLFLQLCQVVQMILRQVLQLDQPSCKSAGAVSTIEAEHSSCTIIPAGCLLHCRVFLDR